MALIFTRAGVDKNGVQLYNEDKSIKEAFDFKMPAELIPNIVDALMSVMGTTHKEEGEKKEKDKKVEEIDIDEDN